MTAILGLKAEIGNNSKALAVNTESIKDLKERTAESIMDLKACRLFFIQIYLFICKMFYCYMYAYSTGGARDGGRLGGS